MPTVPSNAYRIKTKIINMVGSGTGTGTAVFGNGATAVPVRLDSSQ